MDDKISKESFLPKFCALCSSHRGGRPSQQNVRAGAHHLVTSEGHTFSSNAGPAALHRTGPLQVPPRSPAILPHTPPDASQRCQTLPHLPVLLSTREAPSSLSSVWSDPPQARHQLLNTASPATPAACRGLSSPPLRLRSQSPCSDPSRTSAAREEVILRHRHNLTVSPGAVLVTGC